MKNGQVMQLTAVIFFAIRLNIDKKKCNSIFVELVSYVSIKTGSHVW